MSLTAKELEKIAHLARLTLDEDSKTAVLEKMGHVMDLVDQINSVDTSGIQPMAHPLEQMTQKLRDDVVTEPDQKEQFQSIAPATQAGFYLVPKVIEEE